MPLVNEGKLVRIRPVVEEDLERIVRWRRDSEALGGFNPPSLRSLEADRKRWAETHLLMRDFAVLAIETIEDGRLVGTVGFSKDSPIYETMARTFSFLGDRGDRGRRYATEARMLLINYLFLSTSLERIYSETEESNVAATWVQRPAARQPLWISVEGWVIIRSELLGYVSRQ